MMTDIIIQESGDAEIVDRFSDVALSTRENILSLEREMMLMENVDVEVSHTFCNGIYAREMRVPAGVTLTGKIHRFPCINVISKGKLLTVTEEIKEEINAPYSFISGAGIKKAIHAVEDSVWTTFHPWAGEEDLEIIEAHLIVPSYEDWDNEQENQQ